MRTLLIATALLSAFAAHAEPKRAAAPAVKKEAAVDPQAYQPKVIEAKPIELEIKTQDISETGLDKKVAKRMSKSATSEASVLREPVQLKLDDPSAPASTAPTSANTANKP